MNLRALCVFAFACLSLHGLAGRAADAQQDRFVFGGDSAPLEKAVEHRVFYDPPLNFYAQAGGASLYMSGFATSPGGGTVTSVTSCLRNTSGLTRTFEAQVSVRQGGSVLQSIDYSAAHAANTVTCTELPAFDAAVAPGEYEIRVRYSVVAAQNTFLGLPVTTSGTIYDVGIQNQRPTYMGPNLVRGVGIKYSIDEAAPVPAVVSLSAQNALILPGFEVDLTDPSGPTTFFSVRNTTGGSRTVKARYYGAEVTATPLRTDTHVLSAHDTQVVDVRSNTTGLDSSGGVASGLLLITEPAAGSADNLSGDYYRVDFGDDFASGERMVKPSDFCQSQELHFVDFGAGALLTVLVDSPRGPGDPSFSFVVRDQDGGFVNSGDFMTSEHLNVFEITVLSPTATFGTIIFDFTAGNGGWAAGRFSAFGRFSIELKADCRD